MNKLIKEQLWGEQQEGMDRQTVERYFESDSWLKSGEAAGIAVMPWLENA